MRFGHMPSSPTRLSGSVLGRTQRGTCSILMGSRAERLVGAGNRGGVAFPLSFLLLLAASCGARTDLWPYLRRACVSPGSDVSVGGEETPGRGRRERRRRRAQRRRPRRRPPTRRDLSGRLPGRQHAAHHRGERYGRSPIRRRVVRRLLWRGRVHPPPPTGAVIVLFGGADDTTLYGDTWLWQEREPGRSRPS